MSTKTFYPSMCHRYSLQKIKKTVYEKSSNGGYDVAPRVAGCQVYTELLGLEFEKNDQLPRWHEEVKAFEVKEDGKAGRCFLEKTREDEAGNHRCLVFFLGGGWGGGGWEILKDSCIFNYEKMYIDIHISIFIVVVFENFWQNRVGGEQCEQVSRAS